MTTETFEKAEELRREISDMQDVIDVLKDSTTDKTNRLCAIEVDGFAYSEDGIEAILSSANLSESMRDKLIDVVQEELNHKKSEFESL
jgi:hypothetical protein